MTNEVWPGVFLPFPRTERDDKLDAIKREVTALVYAWKERHAGHELVERVPMIGGGVLVDIRCATCPDDVPPCLLAYIDRTATPSSTEYPAHTEPTDPKS